MRFTTGCVFLLMGALGSGCAVERATVRFSYRTEPPLGMPHGMERVHLDPPVIVPSTDPAWAERITSILEHELRESHEPDCVYLDLTKGDLDPVASVDPDTPRLLDEDTPTVNGQSLQGRVHSAVEVREEAAGSAGRNADGPGVLVDCLFRLMDARTQQVWSEHSCSKTGDASLLRPEMELTGRDVDEGAIGFSELVAYRLIELAAREFVSNLRICVIDVAEVVEASRDPNCRSGVRKLRHGHYEDALNDFLTCLTRDSRDHRAAFGAGVACEAMGRYAEALDHYKAACVSDAEPNPCYLEARERVAFYGSRVAPNPEQPAERG